MKAEVTKQFGRQKKLLCSVLVFGMFALLLCSCDSTPDMKYIDNGADRPEINYDNYTYRWWGMPLEDHEGVGEEFNKIVIDEKEYAAHKIEGISSETAFVVENMIFMNYKASQEEKDYVEEHLNIEPTPLE